MAHVMRIKSGFVNLTNLSCDPRSSCAKSSAADEAADAVQIVSHRSSAVIHLSFMVAWDSLQVSIRLPSDSESEAVYGHCVRTLCVRLQDYVQGVGVCRIC